MSQVNDDWTMVVCHACKVRYPKIACTSYWLDVTGREVIYQCHNCDPITSHRINIRNKLKGLKERIGYVAR